MKPLIQMNLSIGEKASDDAALNFPFSILHFPLKNPFREEGIFLKGKGFSLSFRRDDLVLSDVEDGFAVDLERDGSVERYLDAVADEGLDDFCLVDVLALEN